MVHLHWLHNHKGKNKNLNISVLDFTVKGFTTLTGIWWGGYLSSLAVSIINYWSKGQITGLTGSVFTTSGAIPIHPFSKSPVSVQGGTGVPAGTGRENSGSQPINHHTKISINIRLDFDLDFSYRQSMWTSWAWFTLLYDLVFFSNWIYQVSIHLSDGKSIFLSWKLFFMIY